MTAAANDGKLCCFDVEQAFLMVDIERGFSGSSETDEQRNLRTRAGGEVLDQSFLQQHNGKRGIHARSARSSTSRWR